MAERTTAKPGGVQVDTSHCLAGEEDEEFLNLADLKVKLTTGGVTVVFPCYSAFLAKASKVLCKMFASTAKEGWEKGVTAIFNGHRIRPVRLVLAMMHGIPDVNAMMIKLKTPWPMTWVEIEDLLFLANKLDAKRISEVRHYRRD